MPFLRRFLRPLAWSVLGGALLGASPPPSVLIPGAPIERELAAGEAQSFLVDLTARPWIVTVEQQGIDVVVEISASDGNRLAAVDSPQDRQGPETVLLEPATAGMFGVEIRAHEPAAPGGRYQIRVEEVTDDRVAAERAVSQAGERYLEGTAEARRQAIAEHRVALEEWRRLGDRRAEARSLYAVSVLSRLVSDTREALKVGTEALPLWQSLGDRLWEGATWNEIGLDRWLLGESAEGRAAFGKALEIQRATGDRYGEGVSSSNLCLMDLARGDLKAGLVCYEGAVPILREVRAGALEGAALTNVGRVYDLLGEPQQSLATYRKALDRLRVLGDRAGEAWTLNHLGLLYQELGDHPQAVGHLGQSQEIFESLGNRRGQATVLHNLGVVYASLGEHPRAAASYEAALRLRRDLGDRAEEAATLTGLGSVYLALGERPQALDALKQALELKRAVGDRFGEGVVLTRLGRVAGEAGDLQAALASFEQALGLLKATGALADEAEALRSQGDTWLSLGETGKALASLEVALEKARAAGHRAGEAQVELALARAERAAGHPGPARAHAEAVLAIVETLRTGIADPDLRTAFSDAGHRAYELHRELLLEAHRADPAAGYDRLALESNERARARTLVELLSEARVDVREGVEPALLERRTALLQRLSAKAERALHEPPGARGAEQRAALEDDRQEILRDLDLVEAEIREKSPGFTALTRPQPLAAADIQALLDPGTLLLSYALGESRSVLWAVTSQGISTFELPARGEIETAARRFHEELSTFDPADRPLQAEHAAALGRMLLGPVADRLEGRRLVVIPDGALEYVPFGALEIGGTAVLDRHEVVYLPSASALAVQRRVLARRPSASRRLAVLADPVFDVEDPRVIPPVKATARDGAPDFERLAGSRLEAEAIAALVPPGEAMVALDFDASRARALGDRLSDFRVVHFATHGVIDAQRPALSGLVLSRVDREGRPQEGFLHLHDVYNLRLNADLVVLSGCRTALGKEVRGEGLVGLTRGFLYAGAPRVVASLWKVEDRATAALMTRFYRALWVEGLKPAAALRSAQLSLQGERRWRDPSYWAGFVLEGDWN